MGGTEGLPASHGDQNISLQHSADEESYEHEECDFQTPENENAISFWDSANMDPFQTFPITITASEGALIYHCKCTFCLWGKKRKEANPLAFRDKCLHKNDVRRTTLLS